jgi:hypothetical protein
MKIAFSFVAALLAGALFSNAGFAATAVPAKAPPPAANAGAPGMPPAVPKIDKMVIVDNPMIAAELKKSVGQPVVGEDIARKIGPMMYADNILTPNESDLFNELLHNVGGTVEVFIPAANGQPADHFAVPVLSVGARNFLALSNPPDLNTLWLQGYMPMKQLIDVTLLNPFVAGQVQRFIAQQFYLSLAASNVANGYKPLRATVDAALMQWKGAGPVTEAQAHKLAYGALMDVNTGAKGVVPADILAELKPQGS